MQYQKHIFQLTISEKGIHVYDSPSKFKVSLTLLCLKLARFSNIEAISWKDKIDINRELME